MEISVMKINAFNLFLHIKIGSGFIVDNKAFPLYQIKYVIVCYVLKLKKISKNMSLMN